MRILIDQGGHAFKNVGDWAMLEVAIERLRELFPGCRLSVIGEAERVETCVFDATPVSLAGRHMLIGSGSLLGRHGRLLGHADRKVVCRYLRAAKPIVRTKCRIRGHDVRPLDAFYEALTNADLCVVSGGGFM